MLHGPRALYFLCMSDYETFDQGPEVYGAQEDEDYYYDESMEEVIEKSVPKSLDKALSWTLQPNSQCLEELAG
ncbi:hypothetical protein NDU88_002686 [Pleurodeles waltl]|uniref:Uncharacterized protein n=1 Tax=Pleurodeles waltl TaxID=8319 RepID=A0AAV7Q9K5_PLEWA|nr:hypothetical protein NDU88_002686 [Pleurodeles waltl]